MAGITKIRITPNVLGWRGRMEVGLTEPANTIYREAFNSIGMPLAPGYDEIECTKQEAVSRYDWEQGVDVIFQFNSGAKATGQEKFLTYHKSTVTFEEEKTNGDPGAWYYCTAQYYFVGYAREWKTGKMVWDARKGRRKWVDDPEEEWPKSPVFHDWILIDNPAIHRADAAERVPWRFNRNKRDRRRAHFRYVYFNQVPRDCIIARYELQSAFAF